MILAVDFPRSLVTISHIVRKTYRIAIGSDHGGFELKTALIRYLSGQGHEITDCGCHSKDPYDFPISASAVAQAVARKSADRGVVLDGAGFPSAMVANKFTGVRACVVHDKFTAEISRQHSDANVVGLGAKVLDAETAATLLELWLRTEFLGGKYQKRIDQITEIERRRSGMAPRRHWFTAEEVKAGAGGSDDPEAQLTPLARETRPRKA